MVAIAVVVWAGFTALICMLCIPLLLRALTLKLAHADDVLRRLRRRHTA
jgi:hypothetical protein